MLIRKAFSEEAQKLTELALRSKRTWGYDDAFMERVMPDMIVHESYLRSEHGIVAEEDGLIVGYAIVRVEGSEAVLRDLFIEPQRFRNGIGKRLFNEAVAYGRANGAQRLTLEGDPNAIGFYRRMGMRQIGTVASIVGGQRRLPIMALDI